MKLIKTILSGLLIVTMTFTFFSASAAKADSLKAGAFKTDSQTQNQPFQRGAGESEKFRIPAFISLNDGTLFAAADARYETTGDGGGLDTIIALSKDNGKTWKHDYAINYPDSEGFADLISTTCIDPCVVEGNDGTIYVIADMNPTGVTTKPEYISPNVDTGYMTVKGEERLALTDNYKDVNNNPHDKSYPYYLGEKENKLFPVLKIQDNTKTKWALDEWLNIYEKNSKNEYEPIYQNQVNSEKQVQQNAFYKDSALHVYNTGYLLMAKSKDMGETWSAEILNPQIKRENESALLVSPGKGTVTNDGTIVIPFYTFNRTDEEIIQRASCIYSKDNGKSFKRTQSAPNGNGVDWSSESEIVELDNGVLRMFIRNGTGKIVYVDAQWDALLNDYAWEMPVVTDLEVWSGCNLTASVYSKPIDGKTAVMVACPSGKKRTAGKIYTFLLNDDNTMDCAYSYRINFSDFAYSCMDELPDGSMGILYEAKPGTMKYKSYTIDELTKHGTNFERNLIVSLGVVLGAAALASGTVIAVKLIKRKKK